MGGGQSGAVSYPKYMQNAHLGFLVNITNIVAGMTGQNPFNVTSFDPSTVIEEMNLALFLYASRGGDEIRATTVQSMFAQINAVVPPGPAAVPAIAIANESYPREDPVFSESDLDILPLPGSSFPVTPGEEIPPEYVDLLESSFIIPLSVVNENFPLTLLALDESKIAADVAAMSAQQQDILDNEAIPRVKAGFLNINAVNTSAFPVAIAIMQGMKDRDVAKHSSTLRVETQLQNERLNTQLLMQNRELMAKIRALGYELVERGLEFNADVKTKIYMLQEEINSRLKIQFHESRRYLRALLSELLTKIALQNQEIHARLRTLKQELTVRLKVRQQENIVMTRLAYLDANARWVMQGRQLDQDYYRIRHENIRHYVMAGMLRLVNAADAFKSLAALDLEKVRMQIIAKVEQTDRAVSFAEHRVRWNADVTRYMDETLGAIGGGGQGHVTPKRAPLATSLVSGAVLGAALGASVGGAGAAVGAVLGLGMAALSR